MSPDLLRDALMHWLEVSQRNPPELFGLVLTIDLELYDDIVRRIVGCLAEILTTITR